MKVSNIHIFFLANHFSISNLLAIFPIATLLYALGLLYHHFRPNSLAKRAMIAGFSLQLLTLTFRCILLSRPPIANMEETLLYTGILLEAMSLYALLKKKPRLLTSTVGGVALLLLLTPLITQAHLKLSPLPPILNSSFWLTFHVITVVTSYGCFILFSLMSHMMLIKKRKLSLAPYLYSGTFLLAVGTLLGGVWAEESWGRFWDWDPKETWAFVSSSYYLIAIHLYQTRRIGEKGLAVFGAYGLLLISFTWYGVNYLVGAGLHSYGAGSGGGPFYSIALIADFSLITYFLKSRRQTAG